VTERRYEPGEAFDASEGLLTTPELATLYRVDAKTAGRWGRLGLVPHILTPGNQYRFSAAFHRRQMAAGNG
jgi:predicted site-specific integrase-resolvase